MFKNKKGFTLIELMVVIAIIAILATVVLVALQGARDAAEDAKRKSAVAQVRSVAEIYYAQNDRSYANLSSNTEAGQLMTAHGTNNGNLRIYSDADAYCAVVSLTGDAPTASPAVHKTFCLSNTEAPAENTTSATACAADNFTCN
jgi:prepilin-type N-terminal cleavage/methylation domain-containing protein